MQHIDLDIEELDDNQLDNHVEVEVEEVHNCYDVNAAGEEPWRIRLLCFDSHNDFHNDSLDGAHISLENATDVDDSLHDQSMEGDFERIFVVSLVDNLLGVVDHLHIQDNL